MSLSTLVDEDELPFDITNAPSFNPHTEENYSIIIGNSLGDIFVRTTNIDFHQQCETLLKVKGYENIKTTIREKVDQLFLTGNGKPQKRRGKKRLLKESEELEEEEEQVNSIVKGQSIEEPINTNVNIDEEQNLESESVSCGPILYSDLPLPFQPIDTDNNINLDSSIDSLSSDEPTINSSFTIHHQSNSDISTDSSTSQFPDTNPIIYYTDQDSFNYNNYSHLSASPLLPSESQHIITSYYSQLQQQQQQYYSNSILQETTNSNSNSSNFLPEPISYSRDHQEVDNNIFYYSNVQEPASYSFPQPQETVSNNNGCYYYPLHESSSYFLSPEEQQEQQQQLIIEGQSNLCNISLNNQFLVNTFSSPPPSEIIEHAGNYSNTSGTDNIPSYASRSRDQVNVEVGQVVIELGETTYLY